jgi:predicted ATPase
MTTRVDANMGKVELLNELTPSEAIDLFVERARHSGWNAPIGTDDETLIDEICRLVGYIPLAIVLLASKASVFSLPKLKEEIEQGIRSAADPGNVYLAGHRMLINACLNVSYDLLDSEEARKLFRRLLVFTDGADDELIKIVCGINNWTSAMAELLHASLVRKEGNHYRFQPLVRQYALARLRESGEEDTYKRKSAEAQRYYLQSLKIKEELDYKSRVASSLAQLASLYEDRDNLNIAVRLLTVAYDIFAAIGSANAARTKDNLEKLKQSIGEDYFDALLREARSHPEAVIREVLSKGR